MSPEGRLWWRQRRLHCVHCGKARLRVPEGGNAGVLVCGRCDRGNEIADNIVRQWLNQRPGEIGASHDGPEMRPVNCRCSILPFMHGHDLPKDLT